MIEIIKGRYGYRAEDGTIQVATKGKRLSLDRVEEKILVKKGCAVIVEEKTSIPKTRKRKGRGK